MNFSSTKDLRKLTFAFFTILSLNAFSQAPSNDGICGAIPVTCGSVTNGTTFNATNSGTNEALFCGGYNQNTPGVWYVFAGNGQTVTFSLCGSPIFNDSQISIFSGSSCADATCLATNDDNGPACAGLVSSIAIPTVAGTNYYVKIFSWNALTPFFDFSLAVTCVTPPSPPTNDLICNAIPVTCGTATVGTTVGATVGGAGETGTCGGYSTNTPAVWYSIVGNGGVFTASLCNTVPGVDSQIGIYTGTCASPVCLTAVDDFGPSCASLQASVSFQTVSGVTYYIKVWRWSFIYNPNATMGTFTLDMSCSVTGPPNDPCTGATPIAIPYNSGVVSVAQATSASDGVVPLVPSCGSNGNNLSNTVWYTVVGDGTTYTASTTNTSTNFDAEVQIFTGSCAAGFTNIACSNSAAPSCSQTLPESVSWCTRAGTTYYILVGSEVLNCANSNFVLTVNSSAIPAGVEPVQGDMLWRGGNGAPPAKNITPIVLNANDNWNNVANWYSYDEALGRFVQSTVLPSTSTNVFIPRLGGCTSQLPFIYDNTAAYARDLTIMQGARLTFGQSVNTSTQVGSLEITGDLKNSGALICGVGPTVTTATTINKATGLVKFTGTNNQTITYANLDAVTGAPVRGVTNFYNLEVNISGTNTGIILEKPIHILNDLKMVQGNILSTLTATANYYVALGVQNSALALSAVNFPANAQFPGSTAFTVNSTSTQYPALTISYIGALAGSVTNPTITWTSGSIVGHMFRYTRSNVAATDANSLYPVGGSFNGDIVNRNAYLKWSNTSTTAAGFLRGRYITGAVPFQTDIPIDDQSTNPTATLSVVASEGYWEIHPYNLTNSPQTTFNAAPTYNLSLRAHQYPSVSVNYQGARIIKAMGASPTTWLTPSVNWGIHNNSLGQSTDFTVSRNSMLSFSLFAIAIPPVPQAAEFIGASHECKDENVEFTWATASEHNSAYFKLETSEDAVVWETYAVQQATGNSTELNEYRMSVPRPSNGLSYVRLSEYDLNGERNELGIFAVNCSGTSSIYTYPNPSDGTFVLSITDDELIGKIDLSVVNTLGALVMERNDLEVGQGTNNFSIDLSLLPSGVYFVHVIQDDKTAVVRHVVR